MENKKEYFNITSVCREDISALGYKDAESIPDAVMERIASKMADAYLDNQFWIDLKCMVDECCSLECDKG